MIVLELGHCRCVTHKSLTSFEIGNRRRSDTQLTLCRLAIHRLFRPKYSSVLAMVNRGMVAIMAALATVITGSDATQSVLYWRDCTQLAGLESSCTFLAQAVALGEEFGTFPDKENVREGCRLVCDELVLSAFECGDAEKEAVGREKLRLCE